MLVSNIYALAIYKYNIPRYTIRPIRGDQIGFRVGFSTKYLSVYMHTQHRHAYLPIILYFIQVCPNERKVNFAISQATAPEANGHTDAQINKHNNIRLVAISSTITGANPRRPKSKIIIAHYNVILYTIYTYYTIYARVCVLRVYTVTSSNVKN